LCPPLQAWGEKVEVKVGAKAPVFVQEDMDGNPVDLSQYIGKQVVVLDFWSIYCSTCVEEIPYLLSLQEKYDLEDLVIIGINLDAYGVPRVRKFIKGYEHKITYPVVIDSLKRDISQRYQVSLVPTTIVIAKDGSVKMKKVGFKKGDQEILFDLVADLLNGEGTD
jgi:thiol-disulfide isomerase/thioredoxin